MVPGIPPIKKLACTFTGTRAITQDDELWECRWEIDRHSKTLEWLFKPPRDPAP